MFIWLSSHSRIRRPSGIPDFPLLAFPPKPFWSFVTGMVISHQVPACRRLFNPNRTVQKVNVFFDNRRPVHCPASAQTLNVFPENGSYMCFINSSLIPMPVSSTMKPAAFFFRDIGGQYGVTVTVPPACVNLIALEIRFKGNLVDFESVRP